MDIQYFRKHTDTICCGELSRHLGYHSFDKFKRTFNHFTQSPSINEWLEKGHYDLVCNAKSFFISVAQFAGFNQSSIEQQLSDFHHLQNEKAKFKDSFIFVNTCFTRVNQPIFALAACEMQRRLSLYNQEELFFKNRSELLDELSKIIVAHYHRNNGQLGIWGEIQDYHAHLFDDVIVYDTNGVITNIDSSAVPVGFFSVSV